MIKTKKMLVLKDSFDGRVKRLSLHIQDAAIDNDGVKVDSATIFGTLQLFIEGDKEKVKNINFSLPLDFNKDLRNHLMSIIDQAIKQSEKPVKNKK